MSKIKLLLLFIFCKKGMTKKQTKKTLTHPAADEILNGKTITLLWPCFSFFFFSFSIFYWESHTYKTEKLLRCCGGVSVFSVVLYFIGNHTHIKRKNYCAVVAVFQFFFQLFYILLGITHI